MPLADQRRWEMKTVAGNFEPRAMIASPSLTTGGVKAGAVPKWRRQSCLGLDCPPITITI